MVEKEEDKRKKMSSQNVRKSLSSRGVTGEPFELAAKKLSHPADARHSRKAREKRLVATPLNIKRKQQSSRSDGPAKSRFSRAFRKCRASAGWLGKPFETAAKTCLKPPDIVGS
ncbi:MAG: hypothetical protein AB1547_15120, partial [Thermodesulfobacteriota bacterium]